PIIAAPGDDVILPCRLDSQEDLSGFSVEWFKLDMKPDPQGRIPFVFLYWGRKIITEHMSELFIPRVSLDQDGLKRGDVTLKIRNVSLQDEGKYKDLLNPTDTPSLEEAENEDFGGEAVHHPS
uniref:Ig-like domain-containing protein n=1 Tax=Oryzias sinensis TaxID=183150 RepID=A0A8C8DGQ2_9TELE